MPVIYTATNGKRLAIDIRDGGSKTSELPRSINRVEAGLLAVQFALNEFALAWQKELDERYDAIDEEKSEFTGEPEFYRVIGPAGRTARPLPPPIEIWCDSEVVALLLNGLGKERRPEARKILNAIRQNIRNLKVKFSWSPYSADNPARRMV